jgi:glutamate-1-semialdehyde aminotransferase
MLAEGIDTMGGVGMLVSAAHREEDIDRTADSFERALRLLRADGMI